MRVAAPILIAALTLISACKRDDGPSQVKQAYDNRADQIEQQAAQQPNPEAKKIYDAHANAVRSEGEDRKKGLEKAGTNTVPPMPAPPSD